MRFRACWDCNSPLSADKALEFADDELKDSLEVIMPVSLAAEGRDTACDAVVSMEPHQSSTFAILANCAQLKASGLSCHLVSICFHKEPEFVRSSLRRRKGLAPRRRHAPLLAGGDEGQPLS